MCAHSKSISLTHPFINALQSFKLTIVLALGVLLGVVMWCRMERAALGCAAYSSRALQLYSNLDYPLRTPDFSVEAVVRSYRDGQFQGFVLCGKALLRLPGAYVVHGEEAEEAVARVVEEQTSLVVKRRHVASRRDSGLSHMRQIRCASSPSRDTARHNVALIFDIRIDDQEILETGRSTPCALYTGSDIRRLGAKDFALDHWDTINDYIERFADPEGPGGPVAL